MSETALSKLTEEIQWIFLCRDEVGDEHYIEPRIFERRGDIMKVTCLMTYSLLEETQFGAIAAVQSLQLVNVKTGTTRILQEALIDASGNLLHLDEDVQGNEYSSPLGSVAEQKMAFIRKLLRDRKRQRLMLNHRNNRNFVKSKRGKRHV
jgi:hypothetical protein